MENPDFIVPPPGLFLPTIDDDATDDETTAKVPHGATPATRPAAAVPALSIPAFVPTVLGAPPRGETPGTPGTSAWRLGLADGQTLTVTGSLVLGRDPAPVPAPASVSAPVSAPVSGRAATMVSVIDPARSVSKSHALVELVEDELWVTDLHSTNGVSVDAHGQRTPLEPGVRTALAAGVTLSLGEFAVQVSRA